MEQFILIIAGSIVFFSILYFIVKGAVEDGTLNALLRYENIKKDKEQGKENNS